MIYSYNQLTEADLVIGATYDSNGKNDMSGEVLSKLMNVCNQHGFRPRKDKNGNPAYYVLEATNKNENWIDEFDYEFGRVLYYGDNCEPGIELHNKPGNKALFEWFNKLVKKKYGEIPPIFLFSQSDEGCTRSRKFIGLVLPGDDRIPEEQQLVAVWRSYNSNIYQNYKAIFTIIKAEKIKREWINDLLEGNPESKNAPTEWIKWRKEGKYLPLEAKESVCPYRNANEQKPKNEVGVKIIEEIYNYFNIQGKKSAYFFELCAIQIVQMMDSKYHDIEHTKFVRDGGKDAIGLYRIGDPADGIDVEFALEAKRYQLNSGVGVKELSRIISRIRNRQFGILVTTSFLEKQAYKELKEDGHPIIVISAIDIVNILYRAGIKNVSEVRKWLKQFKNK